MYELYLYVSRDKELKNLFNDTFYNKFFTDIVGDVTPKEIIIFKNAMLEVTEKPYILGSSIDLKGRRIFLELFKDSPTLKNIGNVAELSDKEVYAYYQMFYSKHSNVAKNFISKINKKLKQWLKHLFQWNHKRRK